MTLIDIEAPAEVRRDRWGRYLVRPVDTDKPIGYQRATTLKAMIEDTANLTGWACRMTLIGAAARQDIIASALAAGDDRKTLNALVEQAKEAGGATVRRDLGTAVHKFLELSHADPSYVVPEPYAADVAAINAAIDVAGFDVVVEFSERILVVDSIQVAGMCDLVLRRRSDGQLFLADLKTGSSVKYGVLGFCCQLTTYSLADAVYEQGAAKDGSDDVRLRPPAVSREQGIIIHCEPGSGVADLYWLTLDPAVVDLAVAVREIRKRRDLLAKFEGGGTDAPAGVDPVAHAAEVVGSVEDNQPPAAALAILHETRTAWLINRATHLVETLSKEHVAQVWPVDVPRPLAIKSGEATWTDEDTNLISFALDALEAKHDVPFGHEDPAVTAARRVQLEAKVAAEVERTTVTPAPEPPVDGAPYAPAAAVKNLTAIVKSMAAEGTPDEQARIRRVQHWQTQGSKKNVGWKIGNLAHDRVPERLFAVAAAAVGCLDLIEPDAADPDSRVRDLLGVVLEDHDLAQQPAHPVGALFGLLTTDQAHRLADMAETATNNNSKGQQQP